MADTGLETAPGNDPRLAAPIPARPAGEDRRPARRAMAWSLGVGVVMLAIKVGAYVITGSAAILSDAAESVVHVAAVCFAFYSLRLSHKPPDADHLYGHAKISFFSAGFEGAMIVLAAGYIVYEALAGWLRGIELANLGAGTMLTAAAMLINALLGTYLIRTGRRRGSLILVANGKHVLTDSWTSLGVIVGLSLALATGWLPWDPIAALAVAANIGVSGVGLIRQSVGGLMDVADERIRERIVGTLERETRGHAIAFHGLRHRNLGDLHWVDVHLLFPGSTSVHEAHRVATEVEERVAAALGTRAHVTTHLEAIEDHDEIHPDARH
jgi:cation diffusion facilitator family transporter